MKKKKLSLLVFILGIFGIVLTGYFWLSTPKETQAACGASTSSCKTCHEVQGADPVSKKGDWHTQHSFGDFCQACHQGVATETDKAKAHAGVVAKPLAQPDQSCSSCHPADAAARVAKYGGSAAASNSVGSTGNSSASSGSSGAGASSSTGAVTPSPAATQVPPSANPNFDLIDFNDNGRLSWLAWAIIIADVLVLFILGILLWKWKKGLWPWAYVKGKKGKQKNVPFNTLPPEVQELFKVLLKGDMETVLILKSILDRQGGRQFLKNLSLISEDIVAQIQTLTGEELKSLILLAKKNGKGED